MKLKHALLFLLVNISGVYGMEQHFLDDLLSRDDEQVEISEQNVSLDEEAVESESWFEDISERMVDAVSTDLSTFECVMLYKAIRDKHTLERVVPLDWESLYPRIPRKNFPRHSIRLIEHALQTFDSVAKTVKSPKDFKNECLKHLQAYYGPGIERKHQLGKRYTPKLAEGFKGTVPNTRFIVDLRPLNEQKQEKRNKAEMLKKTQVSLRSMR